MRRWERASLSPTKAAEPWVDLDLTKLHDSKSQTALTSQSRGVPYVAREANARYVLTTDAPSIEVRSLNDTLTAAILQVPTSAWNTTGLIVNGTPKDDGAQLGTTIGVVTDWTYSGLPAGTNTVELVDGGNYDAGAPGPPFRGTPIMQYRIPKGYTASVVAPSAPAKRIVVYGDSISSGQIVSTGPQQSSVYQGPAMLMRANALASGAGAFAGARVTNASSAGRRLGDIFGSAPLVATYSALMATQCDGSSANLLLVALGANDYAANTAAATFQTWLANGLDAFHALVPAATVLLFSPITRGVETANGAGSTLGDFRTATATVQSTRSAWCTYLNGAGVVTAFANYASDQIHPSTPGMVQIEAAWRAVIGY